MSGAVAITGASGFVGGAAAISLAVSGWRVRALVRDPGSVPAHPAITAQGYDLSGPVDPAALAGCDAVVHAAWDSRSRPVRRMQRINADGTRRLIDASRAAGVPRFVLVSSMSAHGGARSAYGLTKLVLESAVNPATDLVVRPGLVLGHAGLFRRLARFIARTGLAPRFGRGDQPVQTIHIDDLCSGLRRALETGATGTLTIAEPSPIELSELFRLIGAAAGRRTRLVPLPVGATLRALRIAEALRLGLPAASDSLLGLIGLRAADCRADLERLGLEPRPAFMSIPQLLGGSAATA